MWYIKFTKNYLPNYENLQSTIGRFGVEHFNFIKVLCKGSFGNYMLAEKTSTDEVYRG